MAVDLSGQRVLVVGASSGIGLHVGLEAVRAGAQVVFSARSKDKLEEAVAVAGGGSIVVGDVRNPDDCERIVDDAVAALGGLDLLVFATGISPLMRIEDTSPERYRDIFETNTIGALMVITAAIRRLSPGGLVSYLASDSVGEPYPGLVAYGASKAALDEAVNGMRLEYPDVRFTRVCVGPTAGTGIALNHDPETAARLLPEILRFGRGFARFMTAPDLGQLIIELLAPALLHTDIEVENLLIRPPGGTVPWGTDINAMIEANKAFTEADSTGA